MLTHTVDAYLALRRAAGFKLRSQGAILYNFARFATSRGDLHIRSKTAIEWAAMGPSAERRACRLSEVIRLARHARVDDSRHELPPGDVFGRHRRRRSSPYIFTDRDVARVVKAASQLGSEDSIRSHVYRTVFSLLAATGLRISEALALEVEDLTCDGLVVRETKFKKSRIVPLHETAVVGIERYMHHRQRIARVPSLFVACRGGPLRYESVYAVFGDIIRKLNIQAAPGQRRPHLHSFRHTFAVRALEGCPDDPEKIGNHILALSTYLGHVNLSCTYWYLQATPRLLAGIASSSASFFHGGQP